MSRRETPVRVALAGCGAVGGALLARIRAGGRLGGQQVEVVRVLGRDPRAEARLGLPRGCWTSRVDEFLASRADVFIEAIGGTEVAARIAGHVLRRGGRLVTANKSLIASEGARLLRIANDAGGWLGFEAAVGGGIPIVRTVRQGLAGEELRSIRGVLNGTANFILTRLEAGGTLSEAVAAAQSLGLAEADPSRDLDGRDVADKLAILAWLAWGVDPREVRTERTGLTAAILDDARLLNGSGQRLRLVGECRRDGHDVTAVVGPARVPADSFLGRLVNEQNGVEVDLGWGSPVALAGPGAGGTPTAGALWSDLADAVAAA